MKPKETLYSGEMETALVASALADGSIYDASGVATGHFHDSKLATIWKTIGDLRRAGEYVDGVIVMTALDASNSGVTLTELARIEAAEYNVTHWQSYARAVIDYAQRRRVADVLTDAARVVYRSNGSFAEDLATVRDRLDDAIQETGRRARPLPKTTWTAAELLRAEFPDPVWAVPGLVPVGLSFLAGRPKIGKSWLALQIAHAVGTGGLVLDQRVAAGKALFLALEDSPRRLKERLQKQRAPEDAGITFETSWRRLTDGGLDDLRKAIATDGYTLVVLDTLSRALGRADQSDLADMTIIVGDLQQIAIDKDIAVLVVDHHRKPSGLVSDPVDDIVGSTAKAAVADAALGLSKEQGRAGAILKVTGRDLEWQELALSWDPVTCCWQLEGTVEEVSLRGNRTKVLDVLREHLPNALSLSELAVMTGIATGNLHPILSDLADKGVIERLPKHGREVPYRLREVA